MQQLELQYQDLQNEDTIISKLKERSECSKGNLQAIQATNDLITYQIDEVRKLRVTLMNQNNMLTNYLASQNNKDVLEQTKLEKQMQSDSRVPYGIGKNQNYQTDALKWK